MITKAACAPLMGAGTKPDCIAFNDRIFEYLDGAPPMDVFLFARWSFYAEGYGHRGDRPGLVALLGAGWQCGGGEFPAVRGEPERGGRTGGGEASGDRHQPCAGVFDIGAEIDAADDAVRVGAAEPDGRAVRKPDGGGRWRPCGKPRRKTVRCMSHRRSFSATTRPVIMRRAACRFSSTTCIWGPRGNALLLQAVDAALDKEDQP